MYSVSYGITASRNVQQNTPFQFLLDFSRDICHYRRAVQRVEKWRIQELSQVLKHLSRLLRLGQNAEWASVFSHYAQEALNLAAQESFKLDGLKRLVQNILSCFEDASSLHDLVLVQEDIKKMGNLNQEFRDAIRLLFENLAAIEEKWTESVH